MNNKSRKAHITIPVNNNIERALRQLRKRSEREGVARDMKRIVYYEPPTAKRRKKRLRAIKQAFMRRLTAQPV
jgi:small subunit ribosomal protein S21